MMMCLDTVGHDHFGASLFSEQAVYNNIVDLREADLIDNSNAVFHPLAPSST